MGQRQARQVRYSKVRKGSLASVASGVGERVKVMQGKAGEVSAIVLIRNGRVCVWGVGPV